MKSVELFAGIGGFRLAADRAGIETIWANDFCAKACKVYRSQFGDRAIREGSVVELVSEIPPHDLLTAGFPCQPFSSAGKKKGIKDPRGTLFATVVEVLSRHQPDYFVLENVKRLLTMERGMHFATILASLAELNYHIEWRLLNALDFGLPQNRERVFITGVRRKSDRTKSRRPVPGVAFRLASPGDLNSAKADVDILANPELWTEITRHKAKFPNWGVAEHGRFEGLDLESFSAKSPPVLLRDVLQDEVSAEFDFTESTVERLKASKTVHRFVDGVEILSNQGGGARMGYTVFGTRGVAPTLTSASSRHYERYQVGKRYRRLTNVEYARIQGFPDEHCRGISTYDQYALFGNAVPPPMAEWVLRQVSSAGFPAERLRRSGQQKKLFVDA